MCKEGMKSVTQLEVEALANYQGVSMKRLNTTLHFMKRSLLYMGGSLALMAISTIYFDKKAREFVLGDNARGGAYLNIVSGSSNHDYYYNREFQRMMYLSENVAHNGEQAVTDRLLASMGGEVTQQPYANIIKKAPHPKHY